MCYTYIIMAESAGEASRDAIAPVYLPNSTPPPTLDLETNSSENWKLWKQMWNNYLIVSGLDSKPDRYVTALLLHSIGKDALRVYNGMQFDDEDRDNPAIIIAKFDEYVLGETKEFFERFKFNRCYQTSESFDQYLSELRNLEKSCGFCNCMREKLLMDRIILGVKSEKTRGKLISQSKLDLRKAIAICRADEAAGEQMKAMNPKASEEIHQMSGKPHHHTRRHDGTRGSSGPNRTSSRQPRRDKSKQIKCKFCSKVHAMKKESCPAWGKSCDACKGKNHFKNSERCPKSKRNVHGVREYGYSDTDSSSCASISTVTTADVCTIKSSEDSPVYCNMVVNKQLVKLQVDCGATVNVLPRRYVGNKEIRHEDVSLKMWNDVTMKAIGKCRVKTVNPVTGEKWKIDYVVVDQDLIPLDP